jgi:hypothetical protein
MQLEIYVANTTVHDQDLHYRRPLIPPQQEAGRLLKWGAKLYNEAIPAGQQRKLAGTFSEQEAQMIFDHHHENFGGKKSGQTTDGFQGLIWSTKPVEAGEIEDNVKANSDAAEERAENMQDATAAAILQKQAQTAKEAGAPPPAGVLLEVTVDGKVGEPGNKGGNPEGKGSEALSEGSSPTKPTTRGKDK